MRTVAILVDARAQFRGFFAATWNDVANGPQRGPRVGEGAYSAHRAGEQIRRDMDYVRGFPLRALVPEFRLYERAAPEGRSREKTVIVPRLIFDIGPLELPS